MNREIGNITAGEHLSYWVSSSVPLAYQPLKKNTNTDVLIIGGGIAGLTTAYCLAKAGKSVILIEDGNIGSGESGRTTAHATCALDDRYYHIEQLHGKDKTAKVAASHMKAIAFIAGTVKNENIDCHYKTVDGYLFLHPTDTKENLEKEYEAARRAGVLTEMLEAIPALAAEEGKWCIRFREQGQFHIMHYLKGLADAVVKLGGEIYTQTHASKIDVHGATANGYDIKANHIVVATNSPVNDIFTMHTKQYPYRTYVIAAKIAKGTLPYSLWWDTGDQDSKWIAKPYHYVRLEEYDDQYDLLIAGGEDHKTGQADDEKIPEEARYDRLTEWARKRFPAMGDIAYRWSGQVLEPLDSLAFIGKNPGDENIYIITGDSGNGITHGTLGGIIVSDIIRGIPNEWAALYDPARITMSTAGDYIEEAANMAAQYGDWLDPGDVESMAEVRAGEGAIISVGLKKIAVFRDEEQKLHTYSAVCPHLGCVLQWNADEKSFDCPCHGSRFTKEGKVINGPAQSDLKKVGIRE
ncbi:MAG: Gamma-glutamylputrescine oxidoreductase [Flavipsychrobacter sp.]|jgi:glycine/D-amino acid oxidase-like deaminating enzyme|nr:Gamma-glutamylputrescine oxidoreductase [Flavipsychrobacter sp.]